MSGLEMLSKFMEVNMHIKNTLLKMAPDNTSNYSEETKMKYMDKLLDYTGILKDDFMIINKLYPNLVSEEFVNKIFKNLNRRIENFNYRYDSVNDFFNKYYADISDNIVNKVNEECFGYSSWQGIYDIIPNCKTINETLHTIHSYIFQTEFVYEDIPNISEKELEQNSKVFLKGVPSSLATMIYDNLPNELSADFVYVLSVNEKQVFIMARDIGHALTIDVSLNDNKVLVKYYIPKVCNIEMAKKLRGINKIRSFDDNTTEWATGSFECSLEDFTTTFNDFILSVPTDKDMPRRF